MSSQKLFSQLILFLCVFAWLEVLTLSSSNNDPYRHLLSRGKPVSQSSTEGDHVASLATDGNYQDDPESECAKTTVSDNPYLEVDLEKDTRVHTIAFSLPKAQDHYSNIVVTVRNDDGSIDLTLVNNKAKFNKFITNINEDIRYIRISRATTSTYLAVCEVAVYKKTIENMARKKKAKSSSNIAYCGAYAAVDDSFGSRFASKNKKNSWLRIDLQDVYFVHDVFVVVVVTAVSGMQAMRDLNLRIGNSLENNGNSNPLCTIATLLVSEARSFFCDMFGMYINLHRPKEDGVVVNIAELFVNTNNAESIPAKEASSNTQTTSGRFASKAIDTSTSSFFRTKIILQKKWIRVDLAQEYSIAMIYIVATKLMQFELKLGLSTDFASQTHCVPGLHDMEGGYRSEYFVCVERTPAMYIHILQHPEDIDMFIYEIAVYDKTKPVINYAVSDKYVWAEEDKDATLSCDIEGYPAPVLSWVKNNTLLVTGSTSLTLLRVRQNESGHYECWGNNTHGYNARQVKLRVASKLRVCADHEELKCDAKTSSVLEDFEIRGDQWYSSFDANQMKYLQFKEKAPQSASCQLWLNRKHPKLTDGIVQGTLCLKNNTNDCATTFDVHVRRCAAYYIYNFKNLRSTSKYQFCFEAAAINTNDQRPAISSPIANYALSHKTFQTEFEVAESYQCLVMCQLDARCKSFNFSKKDKICELNTATKKTSPKNYVPRLDYSYYQMGGGAIKVVRGGEL